MLPHSRAGNKMVYYFIKWMPFVVLDSQGQKYGVLNTSDILSLGRNVVKSTLS